MNQNLQNPYDEVGLKHNQYLDEIISKIDIANITPSNKANFLKKAIEEVMPKISFDENERSIDNDSFIVKLNKLPIREDSKEFIKKLVEIDTKLSFLEQKKQVLAIERKILLSDFSNKDAVLPLTATTIAKNSIEYWNEVENDNNQRFKSGLWLKLWSKLELVKRSDTWKADVKGLFDSSAEEIFLNGSNRLDDIVPKMAIKAAIASASEFFSRSR